MHSWVTPPPETPVENVLLFPRALEERLATPKKRQTRTERRIATMSVATDPHPALLFDPSAREELQSARKALEDERARLAAAGRERQEVEAARRRLEELRLREERFDLD